MSQNDKTGKATPAATTSEDDEDTRRQQQVAGDRSARADRSHHAGGELERLQRENRLDP
jgi:hypothetical protein